MFFSYLPKDICHHVKRSPLSLEEKAELADSLMTDQAAVQVDTTALSVIFNNSVIASDKIEGLVMKIVNREHFKFKSKPQYNRGNPKQQDVLVPLKVW